MKSFLKWAGIVILSVVILLLVVGATLSIVGQSKFKKSWEVPPGLTEVTSDSASLAQGHHFAQIFGCEYCHGEDLSGNVMLDAPPFRVVAPNLTGGQGGVGSRYEVSDWDRAIRYGVNRDGRALLSMMPSRTYHNMSDEDVSAVIAYLQSIPSVDNELPDTDLKVLGKILVATGEMPIHDGVTTQSDRAPAPPAGPTVEYGKYLASITCIDCHGANLEGLPPIEPTAPPAPGLAGAGRWPAPAFERAMREGVAPGDRYLHPVMPYAAFKYLTEDELQALHQYLATLPLAGQG